MFLKDLTKISSDSLLKDFSLVVFREREVIAQVISYISEIRKRRLYAEEGYSSLFSFLTEKYRYSGGGAYRRIQASKVSEIFPQVLTYLLEGKLNLMALSLIHPHLNKDNGKELIEKVIGKKKEEVEYLLSSLFGKGEKIKDKIRRLPVVQEIVRRVDGVENDNENKKSEQGIARNPLLAFFDPKSVGNEEGEVKESSPVHFHSESEMNKIGAGDRRIDENGCKVIQPTEVREIRRVKVEFVCDEGVAGLIERAKEIMRHKYPEARLEDLMREAFELLLEKKDPERKIKRGEKKNEGNKTEQKPEQKQEKKTDGKQQRGSNIKSRYIPETIRREVWSRDGGVCTYVSSDGKRCRERSFIEWDHIMPWGLGGESTKENLRLLCAQHNRWRSEKTFGKWG